MRLGQGVLHATQKQAQRLCISFVLWCFITSILSEHFPQMLGFSIVAGGISFFKTITIIQSWERWLSGWLFQRTGIWFSALMLGSSQLPETSADFQGHLLMHSRHLHKPKHINNINVKRQRVILHIIKRYQS